MVEIAIPLFEHNPHFSVTFAKGRNAQLSVIFFSAVMHQHIFVQRALKKAIVMKYVRNARVY